MIQEIDRLNLKGGLEFLNHHVMGFNDDGRQLVVSKEEARAVLDYIHQLQVAARFAAQGYTNLIDTQALPHDGWEREAQTYIDRLRALSDIA